MSLQLSSPSSLFVREADGGYRNVSADEVLQTARALLEQQFVPGVAFSSPQEVKDYLQLQLGHLPHEVFAVLFLDAPHRLIEYRQMFRGTLTQTSVYPREVVKAALEVNAAAVILVQPSLGQG